MIRKPPSKTVSQTVLETRLIKLAVKSPVIVAKDNELVFLHTEIKEGGQFSTETLHLEGVWFLGSQNQLGFQTRYAEKTLDFKGSWHIGKSNELIYTYQRAERLKGPVTFQSLTFRGSWKLSPADKLSFVVEGSQKAFEFEGRIARITNRNGHAALYYALGASLKKSLTSEDQDFLILFGLWRPISEAELGIELKIAEGKPNLLVLRGSYRPSSQDEIEFRFSNKMDKKDSTQAALSVTLSHEFFGNHGKPSGSAQGKVFVQGETDFSEKHFVGVGGKITW